MSSRDPWRRAARRVLAVGAGLVLALIATEVGARVVLRAQDRAHSGVGKRKAQLGALQWVDQRRLEELRADERISKDAGNKSVDLPSPYLGFEQAAALSNYADDIAYFAGDEARTTFDVLVLGGSVAAGMVEGGGPALVNALTRGRRLEGRQVRVLSLARGGYKAPQTSILAGLLFDLGYRPDLVILLDGFNEVALGNANRVEGAHPLYPSLGIWKHVMGGPAESDDTLDLLIGMRVAKARMGGALATSLRWRLYYSAAATLVVDALVGRSRTRYAELAEQYLRTEDGETLALTFRGPQVPADLESGMETIIGIWVESSRNIAAMCSARGIPFVHVLQPTFHDAGSKPPTQEELERTGIHPDWLEGVVHGYPRLRAAGERLRAAGVHFFDASKLFADNEETLYYDSCHVIPAGSQKLARYCATSALEVLEAEVPATPPATADQR